MPDFDAAELSPNHLRPHEQEFIAAFELMVFQPPLEGQENMTSKQVMEYWASRQRHLRVLTTSARTYGYVQPGIARIAHNVVQSKLDEWLQTSLDQVQNDSQYEEVLSGAFDAYSRLARGVSNNSPSGYALESTYFQMRNIYRAGARLARTLGNALAFEDWQRRWHNVQPSNQDDRDFLTEADQEREERSAFLDAYSGLGQLDRSSLLAEIIRRAEVEAEWGEKAGEPLDRLTVQDLANMLADVQQTDTSKRYDLMLQRHASGDIWYDLLPGFTSRSLALFMRDTIKTTLPAGSSKYHLATRHHAVDAGAGTGNTTLELAKDYGTFSRGPVAEQFEAVERNPAMAAYMQERVGNLSTVCIGNVTKLPQANASADLIFSQGINFSLSREQLAQYYAEVARVLETGGIYVDGYTDAGGSLKDPLYGSWKAVLADILVDTVSGRLDTESVSLQDQDAIAAVNGLRVHYYRQGTQHVRILVKGGTIRRGGYNMVEGTSHHIREIKLDSSS